MQKTFLFLFMLLLSVAATAQKFRPDVFGHVADPAFKTLIKERGYTLVGAFLKEQILGKEIMIAQVWKEETIAYLDNNGNEYADKKAIERYVRANNPAPVTNEHESRTMLDGEAMVESFRTQLAEITHRETQLQEGVFQEGQLFGFGNATTVIIPARYDEVRIVNGKSGKFIQLKCNGQSGAASMNGKIIVPVQFDRIEEVDGYPGILKASNGKIYADEYTCGLFDFEGNKLTSIAYSGMEKFSDSLLAMKRSQDYETYYGVFNPYTKQWLLASIYKMEIYSRRSYIDVYTGDDENRLYGVIDKKANWILEPVYSNIRIREKEKQFIIEKDEKWSVITQDKKTVIPFKYDRISALNNCPKCGNLPDDRFIVEKDGKFGIINSKDEILVPITLEDFGSTNSALMIEGNERSVFMDINGKVIFTADFHVTRVSRGIIEGRSNGYSGGKTADLYGNVIDK